MTQIGGGTSVSNKMEIKNVKRFILSTLVAFGTAHLTFSQPKNTPAVPEATPERYAEAKHAIDKGNAQWIQAWEKGDPEMIAALFTEDAVMLSQGGKVFKGRHQILERQRKAMQSMTGPVKVSVITVKIWIDGDTAHETGKYKYDYMVNGKAETEEGRYVTTWKRQDDGSWKLILDMGVPDKRV